MKVYKCSSNSYCYKLLQVSRGLLDQGWPTQLHHWTLDPEACNRCHVIPRDMIYISRDIFFQRVMIPTETPAGKQFFAEKILNIVTRVTKRYCKLFRVSFRTCLL